MSRVGGETETERGLFDRRPIRVSVSDQFHSFCSSSTAGYAQNSIVSNYMRHYRHVRHLLFEANQETRFKASG